jgi:hypothetical protein
MSFPPAQLIKLYDHLGRVQYVKIRTFLCVMHTFPTLILRKLIKPDLSLM